MAERLSRIDTAKRVAARRAVRFVEDGMRVGLGSGSTSAFMVRALGARVKAEGLRIRAAATSGRTAALAAEVGIAVEELDALGGLDLTIDGADEFDADLLLIKGGGGALLREKIVARASERMVVIADPAKEVGCLGAFPLPVEVVPFGLLTTQAAVEEVLVGHDVDGREVALRLAGAAPFVTDGGHHILDLSLGRIGDPRRLAPALLAVPGVVETGLFLDIADTVVIGHADGHCDLRDIIAGTIAEDRIEPGDDDNLFAD